MAEHYTNPGSARESKAEAHMGAHNHEHANIRDIGSALAHFTCFLIWPIPCFLIWTFQKTSDSFYISLHNGTHVYTALVGGLFDVV